MEFNIIIKGNKVSGDPSNGYTYASNVKITDGTGIKFTENILSNPSSGNMMNVDSGSIDIYKNKFIRAATTINSYIYFLSGDGHQVNDNYFDKSNVNNLTDEDLIKELSVGSYSSNRNKNQIFIKNFTPLSTNDSTKNDPYNYNFGFKIFLAAGAQTHLGSNVGDYSGRPALYFNFNSILDSEAFIKNISLDLTLATDLSSLTSGDLIYAAIATDDNIIKYSTNSFNLSSSGTYNAAKGTTITLNIENINLKVSKRNVFFGFKGGTNINDIAPRLTLSAGTASSISMNNSKVKYTY